MHGLNMFGKKDLEKCTMSFNIKVIPRLLIQLTNVDTPPRTNTFGKNYLNWKLQVIERRLTVQVCRWGDVNALVQSKFCSIIHQLSQHLLVNITSRRCKIY